MDLTEAQAKEIPGLLEETTRRRWTEPMRITPNSTSPLLNSNAPMLTQNALDNSQFFPGCTDMVRHWQQLGFIARIDLPGDADPVFVEVQRKLAKRPDVRTLPPTASTKGGLEPVGTSAGAKDGASGSSNADEGNVAKRKRQLSG